MIIVFKPRSNLIPGSEAEPPHIKGEARGERGNFPPPHETE